MTAPRSWDLGRLRMSVGYGRQKRGRHYSPVEVGEWVMQERRRGASLADCAATLNLDGVGHIGRFPRLLRLPEDVLHLVDWGTPRGGIGFSAAVELAKLRSQGDQREVADAVLKHGLTSREIRQMGQLRQRSDRTVTEAIEDGLRMRPKVVRRHVFLGSVSARIRDYMADREQCQRDALLRHSIDKVGLREVTGRLGPQIFTLVGGDVFAKSMRDIGVDDIESKLLDAMEEEVSRGRAEG